MNKTLTFPKSIQHRLEHFQWVRDNAGLNGDRIPTKEAQGIKERFQSDVITLSQMDDNPKYDLAANKAGYLELSPEGLEQWHKAANTKLEGSGSLKVQFNADQSVVSIMESNDSTDVFTHATDGDSLDLFEAVVEGEDRTYSQYILSTSFSLESHTELGPRAVAERMATRENRPKPQPRPKPQTRPEPVGTTRPQRDDGMNWGRMLTGFSGGDRLEAIEDRYGKMPGYVKMMARTDSTADELASEVERVLRQRNDRTEVDPWDDSFYR